MTLQILLVKLSLFHVFLNKVNFRLLLLIFLHNFFKYIIFTVSFLFPLLFFLFFIICILSSLTFIWFRCISIVYCYSQWTTCQWEKSQVYIICVELIFICWSNGEFLWLNIKNNYYINNDLTLVNYLAQFPSFGSFVWVEQ